MGYTHYFTQKRDFTDTEWKDIKDTFRLIAANFPEHTDSAGGYYKSEPLALAGWDGNGKPKITQAKISFNGAGEELSHETFSLTKKSKTEDDFNFCKTARKPYDLVVCALLLAVSEIAPAALDISSDGDMRGKDWQSARDFLKSLPTKQLA